MGECCESVNVIAVLLEPVCIILCHPDVLKLSAFVY